MFYNFKIDAEHSKTHRIHKETNKTRNSLSKKTHIFEQTNHKRVPTSDKVLKITRNRLGLPKEHTRQDSLHL